MALTEEQDEAEALAAMIAASRRAARGRGTVPAPGSTQPGSRRPRLYHVGEGPADPLAQLTGVDLLFVQTAEQTPQVHQRLGHRTRLAALAQAASRERRSNSSIRCATVISFSRRVISSRDSSIATSGGRCSGPLLPLGLLSCTSRNSVSAGPPSGANRELARGQAPRPGGPSPAHLGRHPHLSHLVRSFLLSSACPISSLAVGEHCGLAGREAASAADQPAARGPWPRVAVAACERSPARRSRLDDDASRTATCSASLCRPSPVLPRRPPLSARIRPLGPRRLEPALLFAPLLHCALRHVTVETARRVSKLRGIHRRAGAVLRGVR